MPSKAMLTAVLQASLLGILSLLVTHYILEKTFTPVSEYQDAYKANATDAFVQDFYDRTGAFPPNVTLSANVTAPGNSTASSSTKDSNTDHFLTSDLPKEVVVILVIAFLRYWWLICLERLLPARSRGATRAPVVTEKEDDSREEEIIRKWVEAGKIQRASLSWFNTFAKWILDLTLGHAWQALLNTIMSSAMRWESPSEWFDLLGFGARFVGSFFSIEPLAMLVAFALVPAQKRIVFEAGASLAWYIFVSAFLHVLIPWLMSKELFLEFLKNATEPELPQNTAWGGTRFNESGIDEL